jgi:RNA polymerase sigma factor (sigma-70 family)
VQGLSTLSFTHTESLSFAHSQVKLRIVRASMPETSDQELVERAKAGDRGSLSTLLMRHGPPVYRSVLLPRLGSEAAAQDALSETYAKVLTKLHLFEWQEKGFYPWFRTVAFNVALDHLRANKRLRLVSDEVLETEASEEASADHALQEARDKDAMRARVEAALAKINPRYANAIRLRVLEEQPREEVARALEVTPSTFDVLLHRALAALKKELGHA